jgi:hypothetical protein
MTFYNVWRVSANRWVRGDTIHYQNPNNPKKLTLAQAQEWLNNLQSYHGHGLMDYEIRPIDEDAVNRQAHTDKYS